MREASGPQWVERFPTSVSLLDLEGAFAVGAKNFVDALTQAGATTRIAATYRPPERAYLMHFACLVAGYRRPADGAWYQIHPAHVPPRAGVDIDWNHNGDLTAARDAARAMVSAYGIAYPAALVSRHTERRAMDMAVEWLDALTIIEADGKTCVITSSPRDETNPQLAVVAATYGVVKHRTDKPHWSDDGR